ncbi:tubulin polyglutamylase complex subunit 1 [Rhinophrynus dorsalis]
MMAEKRRSPVPRPPHGPAREAEFLSETGARNMIRDAVLKLLEARPEEPAAFLADYFEKLGMASGPAGDRGLHLLGQQRLVRALWYLRLAHHSQRTAFTNNLSIAYDCLSSGGKKKKAGLNGENYSEVLCRICREGNLPDEISSKLLKKIQCREHEAVPFDVFRYGVLTCFVLLEFMSKADTLFSVLNGHSQADQRLCQAVLDTLEEALVASDLCVPASYLEAGSKLGPDCLALAMDRAFLEKNTGILMSRKDFLREASTLFLDKVKPVQ